MPTKLIVKSVLGEQIEIWTGRFGGDKWAWSQKDTTKNCEFCPHCIAHTEAVRVVTMVNKNKGRSHWEQPPIGDILGVCIWGICPKILVPPRISRRLCQYFGKPIPKGYRYDNR